MMRTKSLRWPFLMGLLVLFVMVLAVGPAFAQSKSLYWERFDVDMNVNVDGTFDVVETQEIQFTQGSFTYGFRSIDTHLVEEITDIRVSDEVRSLSRKQYGSTSDFQRVIRGFQCRNSLVLRGNGG